MAKQILEKPESLYDEFFRKPGSELRTTHYCPGCGHGVIHKLIAEAMDDFGIRERTILSVRSDARSSDIIISIAAISKWRMGGHRQRRRVSNVCCLTRLF